MDQLKYFPKNENTLIYTFAFLSDLLDDCYEDVFPGTLNQLLILSDNGKIIIIL